MNTWFWEVAKTGDQSGCHCDLFFEADSLLLTELAEQFLPPRYVQGEITDYWRTQGVLVQYEHLDNKEDEGENFIQVTKDSICITRYWLGTGDDHEDLRFVFCLLFVHRAVLKSWCISDGEDRWPMGSTFKREGTTIDELLAYLGISWTECEMLLMS